MATLSVDTGAALRAIRNLYCLAALTPKPSPGLLGRLLRRSEPDPLDEFYVSLGGFRVKPVALKVWFDVFGRREYHWRQMFKPSLIPRLVEGRLKSGDAFVESCIVVVATMRGSAYRAFQLEIGVNGWLLVSPCHYAKDAFKLVELASQAECRVGGGA